jgi:hypothetical protein
MAVVIASRNPASVLGVKYTTSVASGAIDPATSTSSITSPSGPSALPVGWLLPPSTETETSFGAVSPSEVK